jgi:hypothetical protein
MYVKDDEKRHEMNKAASKHRQIWTPDKPEQKCNEEAATC